jgi:uncharacterized protein YndB with AHSA1/START domain
MDDVVKSVTVPVPVAEAFRVFVEQPIDWLPPGHTFLPERASVTLEPRVGGRFYERAADGTEAVRGTVLVWAPPGRLVVTWRIGPDWRPIADDERASRISLDFTAAGPDATEVVLTHTELRRHGDFAVTLRSALDGPNPGESLGRYAAVVSRTSGNTGPEPVR